MKWLVTGATGLLGANAGLILDDAVGLTRDGRVGPGYVGSLKADLTDTKAISSVIEQARPEVILHAAALANHKECDRDPSLATRVNADATEVLAAAACAIGSRFIYISTDAVFDGRSGGYTEWDEPTPSTIYGITKHEGEMRALMQHPEALIARVNFFGWSPSGQRSIIEFFTRHLAMGDVVDGFTDVTVSSLYVRDLVKTLVVLDSRRAHGVFHVAASDSLTKNEFGRTVASVFGWDPNLVVAAKRYSGIPGQAPIDLSLSTQKVSKLLGHALPTQREGIVAAHEERELRGNLQPNGTRSH